MKNTLFTLLFILVCSYSYGQDEFSLYRSVYKTADSLKKSGRITDLDTAIFDKAKTLDKLHPMQYFESIPDYLKKEKFNEAAFLYYTGLMRYRYFNSVNPDYQESNDGALLASFLSVMGAPVNLYLKTDVDNFISILKKAIAYYK